MATVGTPGAVGESRARPERSPRDSRARIAASATFVVQGLCFAAVLAKVPDLQERFSLSDDQLTLVLAAVPLIAGVGSILAGVLAPRTGSAILLRIGNLGAAASAAAIGLAPGRPELYATTCLFGLFLGMVDATMNMQGVAVQRRYGRSILASCHAWWSVAGIAGAVAASLAAERVSLPVFLCSAAVVGAVIALSAGPSLLKRSEDTPDEITAEVARPAERAAPAPRRSGRLVLLVGLAVMIMFIGDSATTSWSAKYLDDALLASARLVPLGLAAYLALQLVGRTAADRVIARLGAVPTLVGGSLIAAAGFGLAAAASGPPMAIAGFGLVGVGLSVVVPLAFSAADALDPAGTGAVVAKVNLFNYAGVVVGAVLIGVIAEGPGLRLAFAVPAVLVLGIAAVAPAFRVADIRARLTRSIAAR